MIIFVVQIGRETTIKQIGTRNVFHNIFKYNLYLVCFSCESSLLIGVKKDANTMPISSD